METNNTNYNISSNVSLENSSTPYRHPLDADNLPLWEMVLSAVAMVVLLLVTATGNIFVIVAINTERALQQVQNYFLVSLAVADLTIAVFVLPFAVANHVIGYWPFGFIICDIWTTSDLMVCTASICNLCAIAIDRYMAITDPINYATRRTKKNILLAILIVWLVSAAISVPPLLGLNNDSDRGPGVNQWAIICHITNHKGYTVFSAIAAFFLPFLIMVFVYYRIWIAARDRIRGKHRSKQMIMSGTTYLGNNIQSDGDSKCTKSSKAYTVQATPSTSTPFKNGTTQETSEMEPDITYQDHDESSSDPGNRDSSGKCVSVRNFHTKLHHEKQKINVMRERKAATTLGIVMGLFIICWFPYFLMYVIVPFCDCPPPRKLEAFLVWLGYVNSCCNPVIYTVFNKDFRRAFYKLIWRSKYKKKQSRRR